MNLCLCAIYVAMLARGVDTGHVALVGTRHLPTVTAARNPDADETIATAGIDSLFSTVFAMAAEQVRPRCRQLACWVTPAEGLLCAPARGCR